MIAVVEMKSAHEKLSEEMDANQSKIDVGPVTQ
jgi:hypothetical protein